MTEALATLEATCQEVCRGVAPKHHAVILDLVFGATDAREAPQPWGQPLTRAQAWSRQYRAKGRAAEEACGRMLRNVGRDSYEFHMEEKGALSRPWGEELRGLEKEQSRLSLADVCELGQPDSQAVERLRRVVRKGIEDRDYIPPKAEALEDAGEVMAGAAAMLKAGDPFGAMALLDELTAAAGTGGWRPATDAEITAAARKLLVLQIKPFDEWPEVALRSVESIAQDRHGTVKVDIGRAAARTRSAKLEGLIVERHSFSFEEAQSKLDAVWDAVSRVLERRCQDRARELLAEAVGEVEGRLLTG